MKSAKLPVLLLQDPNSDKPARRVRLATRYELYDVLEVRTRSRLYQLIAEPDFPAAALTTHGGTPLWDVRKVREWQRKRTRNEQRSRREAD